MEGGGGVGLYQEEGPNVCNVGLYGMCFLRHIKKYLLKNIFVRLDVDQACLMLPLSKTSTYLVIKQCLIVSWSQNFSRLDRA